MSKDFYKRQKGGEKGHIDIRIVKQKKLMTKKDNRGN